MSYQRNIRSTSSPRRTTGVSTLRSNSRPRSGGYYTGSNNSYANSSGAYNSSIGGSAYTHGTHGAYSSNPYSSMASPGYLSAYGHGGAYSTYGGTTSGYGSLHLPSSSSLSSSPSSSSYMSSSPSSSFKHLTPGGYSKPGSSRVASSRLSPSRSGMGSRSGSTSSLAGLSTKSEGSEGYASEDRSGRSSRLSSVSSSGEVGGNDDSPKTGVNSSATTENGEIDYKKLYEESQAQNERLRELLKKTEDELHDARNNVEKHVNMNKSTLSEIEKRERRALERKLSEMEEELKQLQKLKAENERLKAENRALTRVVSKLTNSTHK